MAQFGVGALRSCVTATRWWASGLEMLLLGVDRGQPSETGTVSRESLGVIGSPWSNSRLAYANFPWTWLKNSLKASNLERKITEAGLTPGQSTRSGTTVLISGRERL